MDAADEALSRWSLAADPCVIRTFAGAAALALTRTRQSAEVVAAIVAGWVVFVLPVILDPPQRYYEPGFIPFMRDAVEAGRPYSLALLFGVGVALGRFGETSPWILGFATILTLPVWSAADRALSGGHNLLPFEWLIYGMYGLVGCAGAWAGRHYAGRTQDPAKKHEAV